MTITLSSADLAPISATRQFAAYGLSHLTVLVVFAIGSAALVWIGRRQTESQARLFGRVLAALTIAIFSVALVYKLVQPAIDHSVPLQLCDLAELTAAYALLTRRSRMQPGWRSYRFAVITTLAWGAFTLSFNTFAGSDYGFLNRKPANASMLDFLGPWPFYVLAEVAIVGAVWALMTWPWELKRRRRLSMSIVGDEPAELHRFVTANP